MSRLDRVEDWEERARSAQYDSVKLAAACLISPTQLRRYFTRFHASPQQLRVLHLCSPPGDRKHKLILYVNLDGFPSQSDQGPLLNRADLLFTMSEFSSRVAASIPALRYRKIGYMYSPADITRFKPVEEPEKKRLRAQLFPKWMPKDAFLVGWVGRNQWRKQVWILYEVVHHLRRGGYLVCESCGRVSLTAVWHPAARSIQPVKKSLNNRLCRHCRSGSVHVAEPLLDVFLCLHMPEEPHKQDWRRSLIEKHFDLQSGRDIHYTEGNQVGTFNQPEKCPRFTKPGTAFCI